MGLEDVRLRVVKGGPRGRWGKNHERLGLVPAALPVDPRVSLRSASPHTIPHV